MRPLLVIISGPSCSGKTTLAKKLSSRFGLPVITKDDIKEVIFENMGWSDREWSRKVGKTSSKLLMYLLNSILVNKQPLIVESNFYKEYDSKPIQEILTKYGYKVVQLMCQCQGSVLYNRFVKRSESGERHPGHNDQRNYEEFKPMLMKGKIDPLELEGDILVFDTTDLNSINYNPIFNNIEILLKNHFLKT